MSFIKTYITEKSNFFSKKFKTYGRIFNLKFEYDSSKIEYDYIDIIEEIYKVFDRIIEKVLSDFSPNDQIRFNLDHPALERPIFVPFREKKYFSTRLLIDQISKVSQSKREFLMTGEVAIDILCVKIPKVGGRMTDIDTWIKNSTKIVRVKKDGLCLAKSIILSLAKINKVDKKAWKQLIDNSNNILNNEAKKFYENINLSPDEDGISIDSLSKIQDYLGDNYQLIAVTAPDIIIFQGSNYSDNQIYILLNNEKTHADCLLSMKAFLKTEYFCKFCLMGYTNKNKHRCKHRCRHCFDDNLCQFIEILYCQECNRNFISKNCFENHLKSICKTRKMCKQCSNLLTKNHHCGLKKCRSCEKYVPYNNHLCYITPNSLSKIKAADKKTKIFIFYDFETFLKTGSYGITHHVNQACLITVCDKCWFDDSILYCNVCTKIKKSFFGLNSIEKFCKFIFSELDEKIKAMNGVKFKFEYRLFAHNAQSFDSHFIVQYLLENRMKPNIIRRGTKILSFSILNFKFLDSFSFLPMKLKLLPKCFGLECEVKKGNFPFKFNEPCNWNYIGKIPDKIYFETHSMNDKESIEFSSWYEERSLVEYNFREEIESYCYNDCYVLMKSIMTFRKSWICEYNIDCFTRCITIPQATFEVFKTFYLKPETIAIIPRNGYDISRRQSFIAHTFLDLIEFIKKINIEREVKVGKYFVDGLIEATREIFEFNGCFFHGCPKCFKGPRRYLKLNPLTNETMHSLYQKTIERAENLKNLKYKVRSIFECEFNQIIKQDKMVEIFIKNRLRKFNNLKYFPPIQPRDCFQGGRVCPNRLYYETKDDEKILYFDFTSLYPYCNKAYPYPLDHPKILTEFDNNDIDNFNGLIFCTVLPPTDLLFPVLGLKLDDNLIFTLCYACAVDQIYNCDHDDYERSITGTWCTPELKFAINKGYTILKIHEVWNFEKFSEMIDGQNDLFSDFMNKCIKMKIEASGWPEDVRTVEDQIEYITSYKRNDKIDLDKNKIEINPARRSIGKLCGNSFWGRFGLNVYINEKISIYFKSNELFQFIQ